MNVPQGFTEFVEVVEQGSISAAARQMGIPRATLSRRIKRLEEHLGVGLLDRHLREVRPTRAGNELYVRARRIAEEIAATERRLRSFDDVPRGTLRISAPPSAVTIGGLAARFHERHPQVTVDIVSTSRHVGLVEEGFDLAVRGGRVRDERLMARRLIEICNVVVATPAFIERHGPFEQPEDLVGVPCILGFEGGAKPATTWPLLNGGTVSVDGPIRCDEVEFRISAAREGAGATMVPDLVVRQLAAAEELVPILEDSVGDRTWVSVVWPDRQFLEPKVRAFIDFLAAELPATLGH